MRYVVGGGAVVRLDGRLASGVAGSVRRGETEVLLVLSAGEVVLDFGDVGEGGFAGVHFIINYYYGRSVIIIS